MSIDRRNKILKVLRRTHYEAYEKVCRELDITYTFPPEYYRRATRRWLAKKALCIKVAHQTSFSSFTLSKFCESLLFKVETYMVSCSWTTVIFTNNKIRVLVFILLHCLYFFRD